MLLEIKNSRMIRIYWQSGQQWTIPFLKIKVSKYQSPSFDLSDVNICQGKNEENTSHCEWAQFRSDNSIISEPKPRNGRNEYRWMVMTVKIIMAYTAGTLKECFKLQILLLILLLSTRYCIYLMKMKWNNRNAFFYFGSSLGILIYYTRTQNIFDVPLIYQEVASKPSRLYDN